MSNKFTIQALALAGILAVSGLPALAADMTPATPAPGAAVHSDVKGNVGGSVGTSTKTDAKVLPGDKKAEKDIHKDTKAKDSKDIRSDAKDLKTQHEQSAKLPAASVPATPAPAATVNCSVGTPAQR